MIIELNSVSFVISQKFLVQQCIEGKVCRPGKLKTQITSFSGTTHEYERNELSKYVI